MLQKIRFYIAQAYLNRMITKYDLDRIIWFCMSLKGGR
jgi:hypothetical protein